MFAIGNQITGFFALTDFFQWNLPKEEDFKGAVADSVTTFCAKNGDCIIKRNRQRFLYNRNLVHLCFHIS